MNVILNNKLSSHFTFKLLICKQNSNQNWSHASHFIHSIVDGCVHNFWMGHHNSSPRSSSSSFGDDGWVLFSKHILQRDSATLHFHTNPLIIAVSIQAPSNNLIVLCLAAIVCALLVVGVWSSSLSSKLCHGERRSIRKQCHSNMHKIISIESPPSFSHTNFSSYAGQSSIIMFNERPKGVWWVVYKTQRTRWDRRNRRGDTIVIGCCRCHPIHIFIYLFIFVICMFCRMFDVVE